MAHRKLVGALALAIGAVAAGGSTAAPTSLGIYIEPPTSPIATGAVAQYRVVVTNRGADAVGPVSVAVTPDTTRLKPGSATSGCSVTPVAVMCQIPLLGPGESFYATATMVVRATATGQAAVTASATAGSDAFSWSVKTAIDASTPPADLALHLASSHGGSHGTAWTWRITNGGPGVAKATLFDEWGALGTLSITRATASRGTCTVTGEAALTAANIHCALGTIPAHVSVTVTIHAPSYTESGISLIEHPSVGSATPDPNAANNGEAHAVRVPLKSGG